MQHFGTKRRSRLQADKSDSTQQVDTKLTEAA